MTYNTYDVGSKKQVFIDWDLIEPGYGVAWGGQEPTSWEMPHGVRIAVHPPRIEPEPLFEARYPWESRISSQSNVFEDDGRDRLYYRVHYEPPGEASKDMGAMIAYAESEDGVSWERPTIGTVTFQGSKENKLVYGLDLALGRGVPGATVFKDPSGPPEERYKMVHRSQEDGEEGVFGAVSGDGLHWRPIKDPLIRGYMSDTQTVVAYNEVKGCYVGYFRGWRGMERGKWHGRRTIAYAETDEFRKWPIPETIVAPDVRDEPDTDIYTNAYTPWPGLEDAHLMFPAFYQRALDTVEVHLLTSRDGLNWERPSRQPIVPAGEPGSGWEGGVYAGRGLVSFEPRESTLLLGPNWHTHNQRHFASGRQVEPPHRGYLCRAIWRKDGFTSLEAEKEGECTTVPLTFEGQALKVNVWTRFGGEARVEVVDASGEKMGSGETLDDYAFEVCNPITGDAMEHTVTWNGKSDLSAWAGKPVRLRFHLRRARLHAIQFI